MPVDRYVERRHPRVRTSLVVHYGTDRLDRAAAAETVSEGGLHIRTNDTFKVGTRLVLRIDFPERSIQMRGEVVWSIRVPEHMERDLVCGMGVRFLGGDLEWPVFFRRWRDRVADER
jgi:hypothetical protein